MIVTCPNCGAQYKINPAVLGDKGRMVSCASCKHRWFVDPPREDDELLEAARPALDQPSPLSQARPSMADRPVKYAARGRGRSIGWLVLLIFLAVVAGLYFGRNEVATLFPPAAELYRQAGLDVTIDLGLEIRSVASAQTEEDGKHVLIVTGEVVNATTEPRTVPRLRIGVLDEQHNEVDSKLVDVSPNILEGNAMTRFEARLTDVPPSARHVAVRFEGMP